MFGVDRFSAILNPPQSGILAIGRVRKRVVPDEEDRPVVRPVMVMSLSVDHRVVDGAVAARFLGDLRAGLEEPSVLLM
jgi:pyruvate dehydrogenase E2 component (dihydrolipoamide acetyltransferase)